MILSENTFRKDRIKHIKKMDPLDKLSYYMDAYIRYLTLKHDFEIDIKDNILTLSYLWKNARIKSFAEYCDPSTNYYETDHGDNWKEKRWAEKYTLTETGIFRDEWLFNKKKNNGK
jgi:hypothetical protein